MLFYVLFSQMLFAGLDVSVFPSGDLQWLLMIYIALLWILTCSMLSEC